MEGRFTEARAPFNRLKVDKCLNLLENPIEFIEFEGNGGKKGIHSLLYSAAKSISISRNEAKDKENLEEKSLHTTGRVFVFPSQNLLFTSSLYFSSSVLLLLCNSSFNILMYDHVYQIFFWCLFYVGLLLWCGVVLAAFPLLL